jgi:ParB family chromosome partitioning protein
MAVFKSIPVSSIFVGERTRPVDEDLAQAIAASMSERGLINPIMVRSTPARKGTPYTLVAGGHRHRGAVINEWAEIDAIVVEADAAEAQLLEISENLYRNELNALDRAVFVMKFRELWEERNGKVARGGDRKSKRNDCSLIFANGRELSEQVRERLGFGERTYFNVTRIGQNLHPTLRQALRGTQAEGDQSKLLKLSRLSVDDQLKIAAALRQDPDITLAMSFLKPPKAAVDAQAALLKKLIAAWEDASDETREAFLQEVGIEPAEGGDALMRAIREAAE